MTTLRTEEDPKETRALARFAAVQTVQQAIQAGQTLVQALQHAAVQPWDGRLFAPSTIEEWYYRYRQGKFAALQQGPRRDKGQHKAMDPAAIAALIDLRREHPTLTTKALTEELVRRGVMETGAGSVSTVQRRLAEAGLDRRSLRSGAGLGAGPTKAFELPLPNLLWMADCMHGPTLKTEQGPQRTYLFAIIDDCSRLCPHAQFYEHERLEGFLDCLRRAVQGRGVPDKLYTDNGSAFRNQHLKIVCANLGTRLLHCKPYHSWSKGKIERFFRTVQAQFQAALTFEPATSLEELNQRFWRWLEMDYHFREHAGLNGLSPAERFAQLGDGLRLLTPETDLDGLFLMRAHRRVRKDATFALGAKFWEVPAHLRGQRIEVRFDAVSYGRVEIWTGGKYLGSAVPCDKQRNAQITASSNEYEHAT